MKWYHIWENKCRKHIEDFHENGKQNKNDEACHLCYKIEESDVLQRFKAFWKILTKAEESIIGYNRKTIILLKTIIEYWEETRKKGNRILDKKLIKKVLHILRYRECPRYRERSLIGMMSIILDECVINKKMDEDDGEVNHMLNKIGGCDEIALY
ncbi:hypothetical protein RclHR1_15700001 [Rhizophagus clarus]|uniref:Uncharacterized protein n=1 Tax=Rhizophagus clarus TaxID=94130 RepID=A0A2Z6QV04_9GLOM|nr:hypothetical protein RclHR1_15700001 [Rhizophagus clarus]